MSKSKKEFGIRIDKVTLIGFEVKSVKGLIELQKKREVEVRLYGNDAWWTESGEKYSGIKINKTKYFDMLCFGISKKYQYAMVQLSMEREDGSGNLEGFTINELRNRLKEIEEFLSMRYGIESSFSDVRIKNMEIQATIETQCPYEEYARALKQLMYYIPDSYRMNGLKTFYEKDCRKNGEIKRKNTTYCKNSHHGSGSKNEGLEITIYNKSAQLVAKGKKVAKNYIRVEITFIGSGKIKKVFKTNRLNDITDKMIHEYYFNFLCDIEESGKKIKENELKAFRRFLKGILKKAREKKAHYLNQVAIDIINNIYNSEIIHSVPLFLDISEIYDEIMNLPNIKNKRLWKKLEEIACKGEVLSVLAKGDNIRYEEVIAKLKLESSYNNSATT
ncbi:MAG: hypothetical protein E7019_07045 [Alphaproteobacteria bacterium]|nr:hypothetical protein [Alphaproteobacteria bacterium]